MRVRLSWQRAGTGHVGDLSQLASIHTLCGEKGSCAHRRWEDRVKRQGSRGLNAVEEVIMRDMR